MIIKAITMLQSFRKEEDGLALTEYLVLLGLLTAAVILAITTLGGNIGLAFTSWATWITNNTGAP
jgi:pilus assembly protein Flp/PilA